ncbi:MAG: ABC transporter permease, partial [Gemmatimonadales bacterium]
MPAWIARRLLAAVAVVIAVTTFTFFAIRLAPGDPITAFSDRPTVTPELLAQARRLYGYDRPLLEQYVTYVTSVLRGDFGPSVSLHRPVAAAIADAVPNTLLLAGAALLLDFLLGIALGVLQAARQHRLADHAASAVTLFVYSLPTFWLGLVLLLVFGEQLGWFPVGGVTDPVLHPTMSWWGRMVDVARHLVLPAATLGLVGAAATARYQRGAVLEILRQDYVRTARAKGLSERRVLWGHVVRNALTPAVTLFGLSWPFLLTGAVLVESVFSWPGMGKLAVDAIYRRDYALVTAAAIVASTMVVLG